MLNVTNIDKSVVSVDYPAPSVYIDGCVLENIYRPDGSIGDRYISVNYHIADDIDYWYKNKEVINNLFVSMSCGSSNFYSSISSLMKNNELIEGKLYGITKFKVLDKNISISACCCNDYLRGEETRENILSNNELVNNTYGTEKFIFFNKNKDLSLLDIGFLNTSSLNTDVPTNGDKTHDFTTNLNYNDQKNVFGPLLVSHNTKKEAAFAFVFDLEKYLLNNSSTYAILKNYEEHRNTILSNSYILLDTVKFYKKSIDREYSSYEQINSSPKIYKLSDGISDNRFIITSADINTDKSINDRYSVKINLDVFDYSQILLKNNILKNLKKTISFLQRYKELFLFFKNSDIIIDYEKYIFENVYEKEIPNITDAINILSKTFSFYTRRQEQKYISLFLSILHPLNTNTFYIEKAIEASQNIHNYLYKLIAQENISGFETDEYTDVVATPLQTAVTTINSNDKNIKKVSRNIEYSFEYVDVFGKKYYHEIDYRYDLNNGLEVLSLDNFDNRNSETISGLKMLSVADKNARKIYENNKFFYAPTVTGISLEHFSIMSIDISGKSFNIQTFDTESINVYNELYNSINQYNNNLHYDNTISGQYLNLLEKNVCIKYISSRDNTSINGLQKATIYDHNGDSAENSTKYMLDTGIQSLISFFDENIFMEVPTNINQYYALYNTTKFNNSALEISDDSRNNPAEKAKLIISFNNFFKDKPIYSGNNYELWELEESLLHEIFSKKLKLFNKYYILEKKKNNPYTYLNNKPNLDFSNELTQSIRPKFINRNEIEPKILLTTKDI